MRQGDTTAAEPFFRETVRIYVDALGPEHGWTANAKAILASALMGTRQFEEAETLLLEAYPALEKIPTAGTWLEDALTRIVMLYRASNRPDEAARYERLLSTTIAPDSGQ